MKMSKTVIAAFTALVLVTGAAAQPAQQDLPSPGMTPANPFYFMEQASESMALAVARAPVIGSPELESKVRANQASERLAEARKLADMNQTEEVERSMERYRREMNRSMALASRSEDENLRKRLGNATSNQERVLEEVKQKVPEQAQKGIETAIENNRKGREKLQTPPGRGHTGNTIGPGNSERKADREENGNPDIPRPREPPMNNSTVDQPVEEMPEPDLSGENSSELRSPATGGAVERPPGRDVGEGEKSSARSNLDEKKDRELPEVG
jgi:hypothetical protein